MVKAMLLHERHELGPEAAAARRLMHDDAAAGLLHGLDDGGQIERPEAAQIDDLGVDSALERGRLRDKDHRTVGEHGKVVAFAQGSGRFDGYGEVAVRYLAERVFRPRHERPVVMAVERAVVKPLRLEKDDRIV